jgi:WD40 repeat protein
VSGSEDKIIRIWDIHLGKNRKPLSLHGHEKAVRCVVFSPDDTQIVSGSADCTIRVWDVNSGKMISSFANGTNSFIRSIGFSSDALKIFCKSSTHETIYQWNPAGALDELVSETECISHRTSHVLDPVVLTPEGWILDMSTKKRISKLPPNIPIRSIIASAAFKKTLIIAIDRGRIVVMHFSEDTSEQVVF